MIRKIILSIALIFLLGFFGSQFLNFYKQNIGPEYCTKINTTLSMSRNEAIEIARSSDCAKKGKLASFGYECNSYTGTWWLNLNVDNSKGCFPACVINIESKKAEINWRCTGLKR